MVLLLSFALWTQAIFCVGLYLATGIFDEISRCSVIQIGSVYDF